MTVNVACEAVGFRSVTMIKVKRLGHATIATPDLEAQTDYYSRIPGLSIVERRKDRVCIASKQGLEAIELVKGKPGELKRLSFQIAPGSDLGDVAKELARMGFKCERRTGVSPGIAELVTFEDPKRTPLDLFAAHTLARLASVLSVVESDRRDSPVPAVQPLLELERAVLGWRVSDWRGGLFVVLRCHTEHQPLNFINDEKQQLHHIDFEVIDWSEIHKPIDYLAHNN